ncbi:MAG: two-component system, OmpR family, sensor histidine kinase CpxA [Abditibacteriota bacterium]|nr:two-component system, OmpR family, sensor histidine kinase CpxA [Abditibacteriota bacterium]
MNLFWKIFAWFWGAMVVIGGALFGVVTATRPDPLPAAWRQATTQSLAVFAAQSADAYEKGGVAALKTSLMRLRGRGPRPGAGRGHTRLWLYNASGHPLVAPSAMAPSSSGGPADSIPQRSTQSPLQQPFERGEFERGDRFGHRDGFGPGRGPLPEHVQERLNQLVGDVLGQSGPATRFESIGPAVLVAQRVAGPSGRRYALAGEMPRPPEGRAPLESGALVLRIAAVLGTGTLLCYGLARYLTSPLVALRSATRRLAEGDLQARAGADGSRRRDELTDLSRDFDLMAARLETLMTSERRLVEAQRRLLGDVSHELRSPLTRLSVALALARHHETAPKAKEAHERIGREATRLNDMIGQLLQIARLESLESGAANSEAAITGEDDSKIVSMDDLVCGVAEDAAFEARERDRDVCVLQAAPCHVRGSESLLRSAVENVVRNAIRHTREGTQVEVALQCVANSARITVRDYGEGVPQETLSELFKPFYRVESARDRDSGGVGLGLAITERAVRLHGGTVTAGNAEGGGLRVEIDLPLLLMKEKGF